MGTRPSAADNDGPPPSVSKPPRLPFLFCSDCFLPLHPRLRSGGQPSPDACFLSHFPAHSSLSGSPDSHLSRCTCSTFPGPPPSPLSRACCNSLILFRTSLAATCLAPVVSSEGFEPRFFPPPRARQQRLRTTVQPASYRLTQLVHPPVRTLPRLPPLARPGRLQPSLPAHRVGASLV